MTRTVTAKRVIHILRNVSDRESFVSRFLRDGLSWPVSEMVAAKSPEGSRLKSLDVHSVRFETSTPPFDVFIAELPNSGLPDSETHRRLALHFSAVPALAEGVESSLVFLTAGWREFAVLLSDRAAKTAAFTKAAWMVLDSTTLNSAETVLGDFLRRLRWPEPHVAANSTEWAVRWKKAFDKNELQRRFLRQLQRADSLSMEPAVFGRSVTARLLNPESQGSGAVPSMQRFPFTSREDTDREISLAIDPAILAALHESGLLSEEADASMAVSERKKSGSYFTPAAVAHFMCREALREYLVDCLIAVSGGDRGEESRRIETLIRNSGSAAMSAADSPLLSTSEIETLRQAVFACRVCDPAVGGGALLVAMLHEMTAIAAMLSRRLSMKAGDDQNGVDPGEELVIRRRVAESCLYGTDIQSDAARMCRLRLWFAVRGPSPEHVVETSDATVEKSGDASMFDRHIRQADALFDPIGETFDDPPEFDIVIANPPYRSYGLRGNRNAKRDWAARVRERFPGSAEYKISMYSLFFELGLNICRENGVLCYLTPDSFLLGRYFSKLRNMLLERTSIRRLVMCSADFWTAGVVGRPTISLLQNGANGDRVDAALAVDADSLSRGSLQRLSHSQTGFAANPHARFRLFFAETAREFVRAVEAGSVPLSSFARITTGVRSRSSQKQIVATDRSGPDWKPGLVSGSQVRPFVVEWRGDFLKISAAELYAGGWDPEIVGRPKILIRQTGDSLIAAIDANGYYHLNNIHTLSPNTPELSLPYLCAVLNSRLMNRYYHLISLELGRAMAQTDIETIGLLPIQLTHEKTVERIEELVKRADDPNVRNEIDKLIETVYDPEGVFREYLQGDELYPTGVDRKPHS